MKKFFLLLAALCPLLSKATPAEVKASSFGFDPTDATACLQKAIDSGAKKVIVDNTGKPWFITPVKLRSNLELVFARNVVVKAFPGSYKNKNACMFSASNADNVTIRGEKGALLEMRKKDYQKQPDYLHSEWRHCISFRGSHNIVIRDLTIKSSGGDGIYISNSKDRGPCKNVLIENIISDDHHRQGISIISAVDLLIKNCKFINTSGTAPQCGIDLEPNNDKDMLVNNVIENCDFYGNAASGATVFLPYLKAPVSIIFRNCRMYNNNYGIRTNAKQSAKGENQQGSILFENCHIYDNRSSAVAINGQQTGGMTVTLRNCVLDNRKSGSCAMTFNNSRVSSNVAGITFENCTLHPGTKPLFDVIQRTGFGVTDIKGDVKLIGKDGKGSMIDWTELFKKYPENKDLQKFDFAEIDFTKLRPISKNVKNYKPHAWRIRRRGTFLLYMPEAGSYEVDFTGIPLRKNSPVHFEVTVRHANNTLVEKFNVTTAKYTHTFKSNGKRLLILEIRKCDSVIVNSRTPGFGLLVQNRQPFFRGGMKNIYFNVPKGVKEFKIEVRGTGYKEWVSAKLRNASGKVTASCRKNPGAVILTGKRTDDSKDEVWQLQVLGKEDHTIRFGAPLVPVIAANRDQLLVYGK